MPVGRPTAHLTSHHQFHVPFMDDDPSKLSSISTPISIPVKIDCVRPKRIAIIVDIEIDPQSLFQPVVVGQMGPRHFHGLVELVNVRSG